MACKSSKQDTLAQMNQPSGKRTLDIAIVGDSGVGKSSLVNALRNMADDEGAAAVDVIKDTREPTGYLYSQYPDVTLWDLPAEAKLYSITYLQLNMKAKMFNVSFFCAIVAVPL
ncbi:interferon-inducible GTPase 5-like [Podarcis lilfordi]|uniref:Interferon-inducible GTPase 5-like n=1 Tax=Podarcis lilfordi TaxID=74358 RepID=A0AA35PAI8_9SAUR|nr:interferon-inducible GTPase 5-like [Podarcis lilfordi]